MQISLNGQPFEIEPGHSLSQLLQQLGLVERRVAIELNQEIVPKSAHAQTVLQPNDRVELVQAMGGG